eukprot:7703729-Karenia_brevis.AAC.1
MLVPDAAVADTGSGGGAGRSSTLAMRSPSRCCFAGRCVASDHTARLAVTCHMRAVTATTPRGKSPRRCS